ncbi:exported hypothetical protein [Nitrospina gracilis 3/211]|uniref:Outer membrane protein beta-barrel domain-containing protein n=1 Tax=Nitrospina gracilis (strain 3/211) TaxID=1266370 RepID=M1YZE1_NITG3|nr:MULTISPECIES: hypothetical protein [Nitrospina]MCF8723543.1 opacity protein-like surface antigen [Nitrospina sp. Nb-3]CCQ90615.1 exported hypothetical protein [Nitrospina gracilis 3/211]
MLTPIGLIRVLLCLMFLLAATPSWAEPRTYFGVFGGVATGGGFSEFKNETCVDRKNEASTDTTFVDMFYLLFGDSSAFESGESRCNRVRRNYRASGPDAQTAGAWGAKFGFLPEEGSSVENIGIEFIYFERYPKIDRQPVSASGSQTTALFPSLPFSGTMEVDMSAVRTLAIMFHIYPKFRVLEEGFASRFQPYLGAGLGITHLQLNEVRVYDNSGTLVGRRGENDSAVGASFPLTVGFDFQVKDRVWITSQYIFSQALGLRFDEIDTGDDLQTRYFDHLFLMGIRFQFNPNSRATARQEATEIRFQPLTRSW